MGKVVDEENADAPHLVLNVLQQDASFDGSSGTFSAEGIKQDRDLFNVGAGITLLSCNCTNESWTVKALYDYKWNQSAYSSHQVALLASRKF